MTTTQYRGTNFKADTLKRINQAVAIIGEYDQKLTARQVYYQFVARDLLANTERNYKMITATLTDARYAGLISWDVIEDRGREPTIWDESESIDEKVEEAMKYFRLPRWRNQDNYVELWVEKQALAGVLSPIAARYHVPLMVNKGYSSASAMYESAQRMIEAGETQVEFYCSHCGGTEEWGEDDRQRCSSCHKLWSPEAHPDGSIRQAVVLYLGDHDPSGEDMVRDIRDRLTEFGVYEPDVQKVALTMEQIRKYKPPPNPAKLSDSRAAGYIAKHGDQSWELDALPPKELNKMVERAIQAVIDIDKYNAVIEEENRQRELLSTALKKVRKAIDKETSK